MEDKGVYAIPRSIHRWEHWMYSRHAGVPAQDEAYEVHDWYVGDTDFADRNGIPCTHEGFDIKRTVENRE